MRLPSRPQRTYNRQHPNCSRGTREVNGGSRDTTQSTATAQSTTRRRCNCNGPYLYIRLPLKARATIVLISCCSDKSQASFLSLAFRPHPWKGGCVRVCGFSAGEGGMSEAAETRAYRMIAQRNLSLRTPPPPGNGKQVEATRRSIRHVPGSKGLEKRPRKQPVAGLWNNTLGLLYK